MSDDTNNENTEETNPGAPEQLTEKELARRKMLRKAALGTGAAITAPVWVKPVVNTVVLPAHAQTSSPPATSTIAPPPASSIPTPPPPSSTIIP